MCTRVQKGHIRTSGILQSMSELAYVNTKMTQQALKSVIKILPNVGHYTEEGDDDAGDTN